jgi:dipeptidyl-peptidase 4
MAEQIKQVGEFLIEEIAKYPLPGMTHPGGYAFSPDGTLVTFLWSAEGDLVRQLYAHDIERNERFLMTSAPAEGVREETLSLEEKLRRERLRQRELGLTSYSWARDGRILLPFQDGLYLQEGRGQPPRLIVSSQAGALVDAQLSPDAEWVAYVQNGELFVVACAGGDSRCVTSSVSAAGITHGLAEYIAQEEMGRSRGAWWSPDSRWLAFEEVDERHIPEYTITHQGKNEVGEAAQEQHRYPFAGKENAHVRLGVVSRDGGEVKWVDLNLASVDFYLARVNWLADGCLAVQVENREQTRLDLLRIDTQGGAVTRLIREENSIWINLNDCFHPMKDGRFIWASERSGFQHLYLYAADGSLIRALTAGVWMVDSLVGVDEERGQVYFMAGKESPLESALYGVALDGSEPRRLTQTPGMHQVVIDRSFEHFVDTHHDIHTPPQVDLCSLRDGARICSLHQATDPRLASLQLTPPELVEILNRTGTRLHGAIFRPDAYGDGPFPTVVMVYGGPHAQQVANSWMLTVSLRAQYLRSRGYLVFVLDNRGSARRGLAFEGALQHHMGRPEVEDQVDGVRWLVEQGLSDGLRVGIFGWSYGGYMAAMCLARAPEVFKVAVAGAPVTHWDGYDTHYTERYMGTPQTNPAGYEESSVMHSVDQIRGHLLLVHGLIDENVHFRHSARLINALIRARKPYDLLLFPDERHMPRGLADRVFMEEQVCGYFEKYL